MNSDFLASVDHERDRIVNKGPYELLVFIKPDQAGTDKIQKILNEGGEYSHVEIKKYLSPNNDAK